MTEDSVPVFYYFFFLHILFQIIQDILTGNHSLWRKLSRVHPESDYQRRDQLNSMHRRMPELIQEVIELNGNLCFLFCSTPNGWAIDQLLLYFSKNLSFIIHPYCSRLESLFSCSRLHIDLSRLLKILHCNNFIKMPPQWGEGCWWITF